MREKEVVAFGPFKDFIADGVRMGDTIHLSGAVSIDAQGQPLHPGDIVGQVRSLPPLPDTALKLMAVMNDPRSTMDDIVETVMYDQTVTGEVLRLCNSAYFGLSRKVTSLKDAMLCLGTVKVLQLVAALGS